MNKPAVKFAVYALVFVLAWTLLEHLLGFNTTNHQVGQYTRMVGGWVFYVLVLVAIFQTRKQRGSLSFGEGMRAGSIMSLIYSIGIVAIYSLYGEVINKQYKPTLMEFERSQLVAQNAPASVIDAKLKMVDMTTGGTVQSYLFLFAFMFIGGVDFSVIGSVLFHRKHKAG